MRKESGDAGQPSFELDVSHTHEIRHPGQEKWLASAVCDTAVAGGCGDYVFGSQPGQEVGAVLTARIAEVIRLGSGHCGEPLPVVADLAGE